MFSSADEVLAFIKDEDVKFVDIRFCDLPGVMQHFNVPAESVDEDFFTVGQMFDGSSIRGFQAIHESDMKLVPDVQTAFLDPYRAEKTLVMNFSILDPFTDERYSRDPRNIASKAEEYLKSTGIADTAYFGAEAEFYIFDDVRFETKSNASYYYLDSIEAAWNTGREEEGGNKGYKTRYKGGYFPVSPVDHFADFRDKICLELKQVGLNVERSHHEVGTAGQMEINYRFNTLLHSGDDLMKFKYVVKNSAWKQGTRPPSCRSRSSATTARACTRTSRSGRVASRSSTTSAATAACRTSPAGTSVACSSTPRRCSRSRTRRSTPTTAWCRATRLPSTSSTPPATARPACASRSPAPRPRRSASSSACPTRRPTRTCASRRS